MMTSVRERVELMVALIWGVTVRIAIAVLAVYVLFRIRFILVTLLAAAIIAFVVNPLVDLICGWLNFRKCSRINRVVVTLVLFVLFALALGVANYFLFSPLQDEIANLTQNWPQFKKDIQGLSERVSDWYKGLHPGSQKAVVERLNKLSESALSRAQRVLGTVLAWLSHIVELVVIPVIAFYLAADYRAWKRDVLFIIPRSRTRAALRLMRTSGIIMQNYVLGQLVMCLVAGIIVGLGLWALGADYALLLATIAAVTRAIPVIGPIFGSLPIVGIVWALQGGWMALIVAAFLIALHFVESKFILPLVIGSYVRLHPITIIIVLLVGLEFLGILGMFIAPPVAAIVKEMIIYYTRRRRQEAAA
jgi:predicted PurR-regulated permease PerM